MDSGATAKHDFIFTNQGKGPLKLEKGKTTCKCTMANLDGAEIPPGGSTKVTLEWKAKGFEGEYKQTADVNTNDPERATVGLTITGRIVTAVKVVPDSVVLSSVTAGESATGTIELFCNLAQPMTIAGYELVDPNAAKLFDVKWTPLKPAEVAKRQDAKSGYLAEVNLKPGLPVGAFVQTIRFKTNLAEASSIEIFVKGKVVSDLGVVGANWNEDLSVLMIGSVSSREDVARQLIVISRGQFHDRVKLKVAEAWPEFLKVDIGSTVESSGQRLSRTPIVVRIPKGSPPTNHLGTESAKCGRIVLETGHQRAPKLLIRVQFAVEG
jgi:hypothetical protein